jgi:hypothetical protein
VEGEGACLEAEEAVGGRDEREVRKERERKAKLMKVVYSQIVDLAITLKFGRSNSNWITLRDDGKYENFKDLFSGAFK